MTFSSASGSTSATVNTWIASNENAITATTVVCLSGTFTGPVHVWSKSSTALLEIAPAPGASATLDLGEVAAADTNPDQYWSDSGGIYILDNTVQDITNTADENDVQLWHNTIAGGGAADRYNPLLEVDKQPASGTATVNCNDYENLSTASNTLGR